MILETLVVFEYIPLQHMFGFQSLQSCLDEGEDLLLEGTNQFLDEFSPPTFPMEEVVHSIAHEIIIETNHINMMVM